MPNVRFMTPNDADEATLAAFPAAVTTLPAGNLQNNSRAKVWRSTSLAVQTILGTWASSYNVSSFLLGRHNLSNASTIRLRIWNGPGQTGTLLYDSGAVAMGTIIPWGEFIYGVDPWGGTNIFSGWPYAYTPFWFSDAVGARSFSVEISDSANGANYMQAARVILGQYFEPDMNLVEGLKLSWEEASNQQRSDGGTLRTDNYQPFRRWTFRLARLTESERERLMDIVRKIGLRKDFFLSCFPGVGGATERDYSGLVKITQMPSFTHQFENVETDLVIEES